MRPILNTFLLSAALTVGLVAADPAPAPAAAPAPAPAAAAPAVAAAPGKAAAPAPADLATKTDEVTENAIIQYFKDGGINMYFLLLVGLMGLAVAVDRLIKLRLRTFVMDRQNFTTALAAWQAKDYAKAKSIALDDGSAQGEIVAYMADNPALPSATLTTDVTDMAGRVISRHQSRGYYLNIAATLSPLLGLLGTICGMILAFNKIAAAGDVGDTSMVAGGISMALINTALGLIIAVPALTAYHAFRLRLNDLSLKLEDACTETLAKFLVGR
ncbi:hypothetical protein LBMAG53_31200 [Planctomycetota bacterium]|nr:hypothetical protein LBMAG53_31200 [Planctomycetota bacterium]